MEQIVSSGNAGKQGGWAGEAALRLRATGCAVGDEGDLGEHRWAVREAAGELQLGGVDHGVWRTWRTFAASDEGVSDLVDAINGGSWRAEPEQISRTLAATQRAAALGVEMMDRAATWAARSTGVGQMDVLPAQEVKVGTPLSHVGHPSGHVLHHYGTPLERRAMAPSGEALPDAAFLLVHPLRAACRVERAPAAHGRPGGAWRVVLDAPIATYVADGALRPFVPSSG